MEPLCTKLINNYTKKLLYYTHIDEDRQENVEKVRSDEWLQSRKQVMNTEQDYRDGKVLNAEI
jgi:hypothetical protein